MTTTQKNAQKSEALARLQEWLKPGDTVYTILDHVSASGMTRHIRLVLMKSDGERVTDLHPNHAAATVLGLRQAKRDGLIISGCGMDMGFEIVYQLGRALWPNGVPCTGNRDTCRSNDHSNGDREYVTSKMHHDSGYALNQRWL